MAMIPRVTTNAGRPKRAIRVPEKRPITIPANIARTMGTGIGKCSRPRPNKTPVKPATEPTERSIPPINITNVIPIATMPTTTDWSRTFQRLLEVRKCGERMERAAPRINASPSIRISSRATRVLTRERSAVVEFIRPFSLGFDDPVQEGLDLFSKLPCGRNGKTAVHRDANPTHVVSALASDRKQKCGELIFWFEHEVLGLGAQGHWNPSVVNHGRIPGPKTWGGLLVNHSRIQAK